MRFVATEDGAEHIGEPIDAELDGMSISYTYLLCLTSRSRRSSCFRIGSQSPRLHKIVGTLRGYPANIGNLHDIKTTASALKSRSWNDPLYRPKLPETC